jgi:uncharacterized protein involved in exopolysaccharide biosynthesis
MPEDVLIRKTLPLASAPTRREVAMVLFHQRGIFVRVFVIVFIGCLAYALTGTKYEAHFKVLVRRGRADPPVTAQEKAPEEFARNEVTEEELNSEAELIKDESVLRQVAEANDLAGHDWLRFLHSGETPAASVERAAQRLAQRMEIAPVKKTNLIAIRYDAPDPGQAARVLQSLAKFYLEKHLEVHRPSGESRFFEQQMMESRRQLEDAQRNLMQFTLTHGVVSSAQQRDLALEKISDVDAGYRKTRVDLAETVHRVQELEKQLAHLPARSTTQIRTSDNPELLRSLKASLLELEVKRTGLLTKFEPGHRLVKEAEAQIAQTKSAIAAESLTPIRDETTEKDANHEWAKLELQQARVEWKGLQARASAMGSELAGYREWARQLGEDAIIQDDLISTEKAAQENYLLYVKKREEARMGDALDERGIVNVAIAQQPTVPALPVWPAWMVAFAGFLAAGIAGTGSAFARDHLDPSLRTPSEVFAYLDTPVLASLPKMPPEDAFGSKETT